tara:strand:- start:1099 stop:1290 length:192 start_codon:yes stop_codon:yes gene_type:complete
MEEKFLRAIRKTGTSLGINIPTEIIKLLKLKENEIIRITVEKIKKSGTGKTRSSGTSSRGDKN